MARETSADNPLPVSEVSALIGGWLGRLGPVWVDGEVSEINRRQGFSYLTLRDATEDMTLSVSMPSAVLDKVEPRIDEGMHIVINAQVSWWQRRGQLSLRATEVRAVGVGALLAQIEQIRQQLLAEGLLDPRRKQALPFLPERVGLICGSGSDAEHDVVENARLRWPAVQFEIRHVAVQGPQSPGQVMSALAEFDKRPDIDVIVIARGGGSVEDLLGFSDEALCRAVAACATPVVSAIGHEADHPLLDDVADVRASTPTDAVRRIVPDVEEQRKIISQFQERCRSHFIRMIDSESAQLSAMRTRPCLAAPLTFVDEQQRQLTLTRSGLLKTVALQMKHADEQLLQLVANLRALSPAQTLARGYAIVLDASGAVVRSTGNVAASDLINIRVADGEIAATVTS
jgi:exodeoxyribonuclease VII large subunit